MVLVGFGDGQVCRLSQESHMDFGLRLKGMGCSGC